MRAARLLQMLLLLQNRGRMSSAELAVELEVARRTILRDVDAMTEAGLPIIVHQGNQGGIELGFNYRSRLTGLASDEAEAMAVILSRSIPELEQLGMRKAADRACSKLLESFPDGVREKMQLAQKRFQFEEVGADLIDPRVEALTKAIRDTKIVRIQSLSPKPRTIHPIGLICRKGSWFIVDEQNPECPVPVDEVGDLNISAKVFGKHDLAPQN